MAEDKNQTHYFLDGNPEELERLQLGQEIISDCFGKLVFAPVDLGNPGLRVLDSATADGLWLRDLCESSPSSNRDAQTYIGTDITGIYFPKAGIPGVQLYEQSITKAWPSEWNGTFDLVHQRMALPAAGKDDVRGALQGLIGLVKPGGWIQLVEPDHSASPTPAMQDFFKLLSDVFAFMGTSTGYAPQLHKWLAEEGLESVEERVFDVPLGKSSRNDALSKKSARMIELVMKGLVEVGRTVTTSLSSTELDTLIPRAQEELAQTGDIFRLHCVWGRKPSND
ncbi:S-adenosyl-L-methionine-dependent methyltransferase [Xylaria intraflava]|nr:S-adenosyl-L-methionine-dependent methyltransferase [Xylaria intraflava]